MKYNFEGIYSLHGTVILMHLAKSNIMIQCRELMTDKLRFANIDITNISLSNCEVTAVDVRRSIAT